MADIALLKKAYEFAEAAHEGQKRKTGENYMCHCLATAAQLADWGMDDETIMAGLLHDTVEDTDVTIETITKEFGPTVAQLVEGVSKLTKVKYRGIDRYVESLRRMCLAMAKDARVIIIKCADRIHNLRTLDALPPEKQKRIAMESIEIYAAIANRLGMGEIRGQLEDLSFPYILPEEYVWLTKKIEKPYEAKKAYLKNIIAKVKRILKENDIKYVSVHGRGKHLYSLYKKLLQHNRDLSKIYDLIALRIIVKDVADCYTALGLVHEYWTPLKGRIKDYIAQQKPNGYQSLHTTVFCDQGEIVEFQIRTQKMHIENEFGVAAHWQFKANNKKKRGKKKELMPWMKQIEKIQKEAVNEKQFLESMKGDVFKNRIFVFTPQGDVIELPEGATAVDFAYQIHTDLGNHCSGAKVNDKIQNIKTVLKSGDVVEIFSDKKRKGPNPDWLDFVVTNTARSQIKKMTQKPTLTADQ